MAMRLLALAATLSTGCSFLAVSTPHERPAPPLECKAESAAPGIDAVVGGLALLLGTTTIVKDQRGPIEDRGLRTIFVGLPALAIGATYSVSAIYGFTQTSRCRRFHRELGIPIVPAPDPAATRARALQLTKAAEIAARSGRCRMVVQLDHTVKQLDAEVHATEFLRDPGIARCLAAPPAP